MFGVIYKILNKANGKIYFGQTRNKRGFYGRYYYKCDTDIERVYKFHKHLKEKGRSYNSHLLSAIEKYGFECWEIDKQFDTADNLETLNKLEDLYIRSYQTVLRSKGYNNKFGGDSNLMLEETKIKISQKAKLRTGSKNSFYGRKHSAKTIESIRAKQTGKKYSIETNSKKGKQGNEHNNSKKVVCLNTKEIFSYMGDACIKYDLSRGHLTSCCKGDRKSCGNVNGEKLVWKYYDDYINLREEEIKAEIEKVQNIKTNNKPIICITTNKTFLSTLEAAKYYNIKSSSSITACCKGKYKYCGTLENGTKLQWKYL